MSKDQKTELLDVNAVHNDINLYTYYNTGWNTSRDKNRDITGRELYIFFFFIGK